VSLLSAVVFNAVSFSRFPCSHCCRHCFSLSQYHCRCLTVVIVVSAVVAVIHHGWCFCCHRHRCSHHRPRCWCFILSLLSWSLCCRRRHLSSLVLLLPSLSFRYRLHCCRCVLVVVTCRHCVLVVVTIVSWSLALSPSVVLGVIITIDVAFIVLVVCDFFPRRCCRFCCR